MRSPGSLGLFEALRANPRRSLLAVLFFLIAAGVVGGPVAGALEGGGFTSRDADSVQAVERLQAATGTDPNAGIVLIVEGGGAEAVADELDAIDGLAEVNVGGSSTAGTSTVVLGTLESAADEKDVATDVVAAFKGDDEVTIGGPAVIGLQLQEQVGKDLGRAELLAFPILALLSIVFFGGRGAVLPLLVGMTTVVGTFLVMTAINTVYGLNVFALNLVIGLGLGLAIDYTLFLLSRYREELAVHGPTAQAVANTMRTAGRTVAFSAATVAVALITLAVFPLDFLRSMGIAGAVVAIVAGFSSLLISPAIFGLWGAKLARRPARRQKAAARSEGRWYRFSHAVMLRPGVIAFVTAGIMLLLASPALRAEWSPIDDSVIPEDLSSRVVADTLTTEFPESNSTVTVAIQGGMAESQEFASRVSSLPGVLDPAEADDLGGGIWQIGLKVAGDAAGPDAQQVVHDVRDLAVETDTDALVAGPAADFIDQLDGIADTLPFALGLLVMLTLLVLWLMTGSVVLPIKAVLMNVLTVGVALGALVFIYQDGRLSDLLGYTPNGGVEASDFLVTATLIFALSTDYGVFLLGRIKEARDHGLTERESVAAGLGRTGSVVTAAAILLAVAIGAFSTSEISFIQQIGIATAVGVLVDAFIVRSLLVPSLMALLGKWNWWAPMWLRRVHDRIGFSEGPSTPLGVAPELETAGDRP